jgi:hypothetical protein
MSYCAAHNFTYTVNTLSIVRELDAWTPPDM